MCRWIYPQTIVTSQKQRPSNDGVALVYEVGLFFYACPFIILLVITPPEPSYSFTESRASCLTLRSPCVICLSFDEFPLYRNVLLDFIALHMVETSLAVL